MTIRVLLADDQALVRAGFRMILEAQDDVDVVGEAGDGTEAIALAQTHAPDVVLIGCAHAASRRGCSAAPTVTRRLLADFVRIRPAPRPASTGNSVAPLTARESDTLGLLAKGLSNAAIAAELVVSEHTVETHVGNVFLKPGLRDRVHAVIYAYEHGVVRSTETV